MDPAALENLKTLVVNHGAALASFVAAHSELQTAVDAIEKVEAEVAAKVPTLADIKALLARVPE